MYFKELQLIGFKSFLDKTTLRFEPGITAIVGPNGCGKSNVFDSIRWVLGEQSAKSLRGSEMQDVIFSGTDKKEALGMAEVTLTFDNSARFFPLDTSEVAVTRRLFRSGESEYLLNKAPVRLKDINEILLGTGIGAESYSIVAQGKIDLVLSSKPDERRMVFDEASGITKFKADKRETIRKLEDTEANLARINDIICEVKRQISSLERQANKARKYKDAFEELKSKESQSALAHLHEFSGREEGLAAQIRELSEQESVCEARLRDQESRISNRQSELKEAESKLMAVKEELLTLENTVLRSHERITFNREKIGELQNEDKSLEEQLTRLKEKLASDQEKLSAARQEYDSLSAGIEGKKRLFAEQQEKITAFDRGIKQAQQAINQAKQSIVALAARISNAKNEINDFSSQQQIFQARRKRLEIERAKINEEETMTCDSLREVTQEVEALKVRLDQTQGSLDALLAEADGEKVAVSGLKSQVENCQRQILTLRSHKEFLEELRTKYDDISEAMEAVVYLNRKPVERLSGLVVKINEAAASSGAEAVGNPPWPQGFRCTGEAKPMELDTRRIDDKIAQLGDELSGLTQNLEAKEARIDELSRQRGALEKELRQQELSFANKETNRKAIHERFTKIKQEADVIVIELADCERELTTLSQNLTNSTEFVAKLQQEQREAESVIVGQEEMIVAETAARELSLVACTQTRTELDGLNQRILSDEGTLKIIEDAFSQDTARLNNCVQQRASIEQRRLSLSSEITVCEAEIEQASLERQKRQETLKSLEDGYQSVADTAQNAVTQVDSDRQELSALKNRLYDLQMEIKDIEYRCLSIRDRMVDAYKVTLDQSAVLPEGIDTGVLESEIQELKRRVDSYGAVNLVAIEEYDELKQRYDFLIQQQTDLTTAKDALHQAILKINRTTKQLFLETFEKVKVEFRNYFRILFNGGDAQIFLTDESDPLESGIEIICRPPGKKLQNVLLLSGGEKAMSAIALIFAIFKVKPSPFCVLDEIDAALDEANVDRLGRILQEFSLTSQFIVITHNKRTIANANVMYGITMQESGVSKIVSVKFAENEHAGEEDAVTVT